MLRSVALLLVFVSVTAAAAIAEADAEPNLQGNSIAEACADKEESCEGWKSDGMCESQRDLMSYYCAATCGICSSVAEATAVLADVVETIVEATDSTRRDDSAGDQYWDNYNYDNADYDSASSDSAYDAGYDSSSYDAAPSDSAYDTGYDSSSYDSGSSYDASSYDTVDVPADTPATTAAITNQCAGEVRNGLMKEMRPSNYGFVECEAGFTRNGPYYIYCNEAGLITGELPTCERKCSEITVDGGNIDPPESDKQGWLYVSCNEGFTLEGNAWNWCDKGVVDYMPTCTGGAAVADVVAEDAGIVENESVDNAGDASASNDYYSDIADDSAAVEPADSSASGAAASGGDYSGCPLELVENGVWTDPYQSATYWILECNAGFVKSGGDDYTYCDEQKTVMGVSPECGADKCAATTVENGVVSTSGEGSWIWVQVDCVEGFNLLGSAGSYCNSQDGTLSGDVGTCSK